MSTLIVNKITPKSGTSLEYTAATLKMSGSTSGDLTFEMDQNTGTAANFQIVAPASTQRVDFHYDKDLGNTAVMSFASQKVGINNLSPSHALDVAGSANVSSHLTVGGDLTVNGTMTTINTATMTVDDNNIDINAVDSPTDANCDGGGITLKGTTDKTISWTNSTDSWHYNQGINITSGKLAIGTTAAPTSNLEIEGSSGDLIFEIDNNASNSANLQVIAPEASPRIDFHLDKDLGNTAIMSFKQQRVGINNITPTKPLDVSGDIRHATASGDLTFEMANSAANSSTFKVINGAGNQRADLVLDDNTHITMKGQRVGILQTTPTKTLDVTGDARVTTDLTVGDDLFMLSDGSVVNFGADSDISLTHTADTSLTLAGAGSTTGLVVNNTATDGDPFMAFALGGTQTFTMGIDDGDSDKFKIGTTAIGTNTRLTIDSSGNVGIGASTPTSLLELEVSSGDAILEIDNNASNSANFQIQNGAGNARVDMVMNDGSTSTTLTLKDQKIGIMDTSPSHTLDVNGTGQITGNTIIGGDLTVDTSTLVVDSSNNRVGIGVTDPDSSLEVLSTSTQLKLSYDGSNAATAAVDSGGDLTLTPSGNGITLGSTSALEMAHNSGDMTFIMDNDASNAGEFKIEIGAGNLRTDMVFNNGSNNTTMTFKGQRVGVMQTNPASTLDVTGDANITTDLTLGGVLSLADGSASAPSLTNTGDTNCGLFFSDTDTLAFTAGGTAQITFADGVVAPVTNDDVDLGTSSLRFKNIFTMDLHLANERGDWTVIEEEDYLSLRNNKNGKMFKILMQEISEE